MKKTNPKEVSLLGKSVNRLPATPAEAELEGFPNAYPGREYWIFFDYPHFTSLCPVTGQPDFATVRIEYIPDAFCIETKSLKLYLQAYRNERGFNEEIINRIYDDFIAVIGPKRLKIRGEFASRGGISLSVAIDYEKSGN